MRLIVPFVALTLVAAPASADAHWPRQGDIVTPDANGLSVAGADGSARDAFPFGSGFQDTMHMLVSIFGSDVNVAFPQECGAGPLVSAVFPGQISLMFQDDELAGWMLINDASLRMADGLGVGTPRSALSKATFFDSSIGTEFDEGGIFGLLSDDGTTVQAAWAGTSCIFR